MLAQIQAQTNQIIAALLDKANLPDGALFVVGCSTSEIAGQNIGTSGSLDIANAVFEGLYPILRQNGIALAVQCCEHLNRALVIESQTAATKGYPAVSAIPAPKAGGTFASAAWNRLSCPVLVEHIQANAGIDIGSTLIGMHLAHVAVPIRTTLDKIGHAHVVCAVTRPKFIGGKRAVYE